MEVICPHDDKTMFMMSEHVSIKAAIDGLIDKARAEGRSPQILKLRQWELEALHQEIKAALLIHPQGDRICRLMDWRYRDCIIVVHPLEFPSVSS
jgi:hypothetical protein